MGWTCPCGTSNGDNLDRCRSSGRALFLSTQAGRPSADRIDQTRAIRQVAIVAVVALISVIGLWVVVRALFSGSSETKQSASASVAAAPSSYSNTTPVPAPESKETHPVPTGPPLSEKEIKALEQQRASSVELLKTVEGMLNAHSFAAKAEIYCRFSSSQLTRLYGMSMSGEQIEQRYEELLRAEPTTQQGEFQRRRQLEALETFVVRHHENISQCQNAAVMGMERIPPDQELRAKADQTRGIIAEIDKVLASGVSPVIQAPPPTAPSDAIPPSLQPSPIQPVDPFAAPSAPQTAPPVP